MDKLFEALESIIEEEYKIIRDRDNILRITESSVGAKCKYVDLKTRGKTFAFSLDRDGPKKFHFLTTPRGSRWNKATDGIIVSYDKDNDILYVFIVELKSDKVVRKQIPYGKIHFDLVLKLIEESFNIPIPKDIRYKGIIFGTEELARKGTTRRSNSYVYSEKCGKNNDIDLMLKKGEQQHLLTNFMK